MHPNTLVHKILATITLLAIPAACLTFQQLAAQAEIQIKAVQDQYAYRADSQLAKRARILDNYDDKHWVKKNIIDIVDTDWVRDVQFLAANTTAVNWDSGLMGIGLRAPGNSVDDACRAAKPTLPDEVRVCEELKSKLTGAENVAQILTRIPATLKEWFAADNELAHFPFDPKDYIAALATDQFKDNIWWRRWYQDHDTFNMGIFWQASVGNLDLKEDRSNAQAVAYAKATKRAFLMHEVSVAMVQSVKQTLKKGLGITGLDKILSYSLIASDLKGLKSNFQGKAKEMYEGVRKVLKGEGKYQQHGISETLERGLRIKDLSAPSPKVSYVDVYRFARRDPTRPVVWKRPGTQTTVATAIVPTNTARNP